MEIQVFVSGSQVFSCLTLSRQFSLSASMDSSTNHTLPLYKEGLQGEMEASDLIISSGAGGRDGDKAEVEGHCHLPKPSYTPCWENSGPKSWALALEMASSRWARPRLAQGTHRGLRRGSQSFCPVSSARLEKVVSEALGLGECSGSGHLVRETTLVPQMRCVGSHRMVLGLFLEGLLSSLVRKSSTFVLKTNKHM